MPLPVPRHPLPHRKRKRCKCNDTAYRPQLQPEHLRAEIERLGKSIGAFAGRISATLPGIQSLNRMIADNRAKLTSGEVLNDRPSRLAPQPFPH
jgi:hypothetical protein